MAAFAKSWRHAPCRGPFSWLERTPHVAHCNSVRQQRHLQTPRCRVVEPRQGCPLGGVPLFAHLRRDFVDNDWENHPVTVR
jgi:hypothetical protein